MTPDEMCLYNELILERNRLQALLDKRPAINAGLIEAYVKWSHEVGASDVSKILKRQEETTSTSISKLVRYQLMGQIDAFTHSVLPLAGDRFTVTDRARLQVKIAEYVVGLLEKTNMEERV